MAKDLRHLLSDEALNEIMERTKVLVNDLVNEGTASIESNLVVCGLQRADDGEMHSDVVTISMSSVVNDKPSVKHAAFASVGYSCITRGLTPFLALFVSEAWMAKAEEDELDKGDFKRPSERDDREEIIAVSALSSDARTAHMIFTVSRDEHQHFVIEKVEEVKFGEEKDEKMSSYLLESFFAGCAGALREKKEDSTFKFMSN